jgi:hypothetical protein
MIMGAHLYWPVAGVDDGEGADLAAFVEDDAAARG